jgi:hypothetical protein
MAEHLKTALTLRRTVVGWTSLHEKKGALEIAEQCEAPLVLPENVTDPAAPEAAAALKAKCGAARGRLTLAMPTDQVLMRVVQLPSTDPAELKSMADLQVDKFSPFPVEHMAIGLEVLSSKDNVSRVLIAAAQLEHVEKLGAAFTRAGLSPRSVDVEVMGWWWLLKNNGLVPESGRQALLVIDEHCAELIVAQDGVPLLLRSLGASAGASPVEAAAETADELNYTLTTIESEWGALPTGPLQIWHADAVPQEYLAHLREQCGQPAEAHSLAALPTLSEGLARRAAARGPGMLDLAPAHWGAEMHARKTRRGAIVAAAVVLGIWLLGMLAFLLAWQIRQSALGKVRAEAARLSGPAKEVRQIQDQIRALEKYGDRTFSGLECLRDVSERLSEGVDLTSFSYKKYRDVSLRGEADTSDPIYDFFKKLEESTLFTNVAPEGVTDEVRGGRRRAQFRVTCTLPGEES